MTWTVGTFFLRMDSWNLALLPYRSTTPEPSWNFNAVIAKRVMALKRISFMHFCILTATTSSSIFMLLGLLKMLAMVSRKPLTAQESQKNPNPTLVLNSRAEAKGVLMPVAILHITDRRIAKPVPAMPIEHCVKSSVISGPAFFSERIVELLLSLSSKMDRNASLACI